MQTFRLESPELARALAQDGQAVVEIAGRQYLIAEVEFVQGDGEFYDVPEDEIDFVREALREDGEALMTGTEVDRWLKQRRQARADSRLASKGG